MGSKRKAEEKSTPVPTRVTRGAAAARKQEEEMKSSTPAVTASESNAKGKQTVGNNLTSGSSGLKLKINLNSSNPAKKLKNVHPTPPAQQSPSTSLPAPAPPPVDPRLARRFIPLGPRRTATLGKKDESLLTITCHCASTNTTNELHFRKIPREAINWDDATHITKINAWRNQIFGRAGIKARSVNQWHECEELWLELYFQLSIRKALSRGSGDKGIKVPNTCLIRHEFNKVFVGKILFTRDGTALPPRQERLGNAFSSKFARVSLKLKARLQAVLLGKNNHGGDEEGAKEVYMPHITLEMVESYREMRMRLEEMGVIGGSGGEEESEYRHDLEAWRRLVGNLPEEEEDEQKGEEEKEGEFDDDQATISAVAEDSNSDRDVWMCCEANQETSSEDEELSIQEKEEDAIIALWRLSRNPVLHTGFIEFVPEDEYLARPNFPQNYDYDYDYGFEFGPSSSRDFGYGGGVYNTTYRYTNSYMRST